MGKKEKNHAGAETTLERRVEQYFPSKESAYQRINNGQKLKFYWGIDPTGPDIHLGHVVQLLLLKDLGRLGHSITVLIGDFTAAIGDPTGKISARRQLPEAEVQENEASYREQLERIFEDVPFQVRHNSEWLAGMTLKDVIRLASRVTVQQIEARDMFQERIRKEQPVFVHEFLYPLLQGYDSVALETDGEVGGSDQIFNMLVGREFAKEYLKKDKIVLATKLLIDSNSGKKMSKSEGSLISVRDEPQEIRRKILALDDGILRTIAELCTEKPEAWMHERYTAGGIPKDARKLKEELSDELVRMFHGESKIKMSREAQSSGLTAPSEDIVSFLIKNKLAVSRSEAKRFLEQKAVSINGEPVKEWDRKVAKGDTVQVGPGKFIKAV